MFVQIILLILGLVLILVGANGLTDGSSTIAKRFGVSDLVIGLTVVAFGTSAPELVITVMSAVQGNGGLAIGNVVGSNVFNILAIIGITAIVCPIKVEKTVMSREIPMAVLSALILMIMGCSHYLNGGGASILTRVDGLILLVFFGIFMWYTFASAHHAPVEEPKAQAQADKKPMPMLKAIIWVAVGLAMLVYGGELFVRSATGIASAIGVSDTIIGLTIAACGTSLPELATSIVAAIKRKTDMAIGNVIGSNVFNVFLILGTGATISPMGFGGIGLLDLSVLMGASLIFLAFGWWFGERIFTRAEGCIMAGSYVAYITYLCVTA